MDAIKIRGVQYRSLAAAARDLGVSVAAIHKARRNGRLATVGLGQIGSPKNCSVGGNIYESQTAAAEDLGVTTWQISNYLKVQEALQKKLGK